MMGRWPFALFTVLLAVSLSLIGLLERFVLTDMRTLASARNDDVSWRMSQLEVELLRFQTATQAARAAPDTSLDEMRKRFDIFYSRISTLRQSALYQSFKDDREITTHLDAALAFLDQTTPLIDAKDQDLRSALDQIYSDINALAPSLRNLALSGIDHFTQQEAQQRATFTRTLTNLVVSIIALITVLFIALAILIMLYRRGNQISQTSEIARARFEAAISSSLDAVLVVDSAGHIIEFNGAAQTVFGYARDDVIGKDMAHLIVPTHLRDAHSAGMQRFLETGNKRVIDAGRIRLEALRKSGEVFPVELSISLSKARGETVFVSYLRDITKEIQAEEDLKEALHKAQLGEKAKSNLLTVMSHEMRTPLNGILGSLELIEHSNLTDSQQQHLNAIAVSGDLLLSHVNDVLDFSKLSAGSTFTERSVFDLSELIRQSVDSLSGNASAAGNSLSTQFHGTDLTFVQGYRRSLQRCIMNLVGNAIKFTHNGTIQIEVERLPNEDVEIRVADTGVGISADDLETIFDEFVTVDSAFDRTNNGTGLGLAITKRLVTQMDGEIEADSIPDEGSLFSMRLPLPPATPKATERPTASTAAPKELARGFKALVVDDNKINRDILSAIIEDLGGEVATASNGYDAIDLASEMHFDALMLDISMPQIDGIETLRRIREITHQVPAPPAIAVTAHAAPEDHRKILASGFTSLLVKPVTRTAAQECLAGAFDLPLATEPDEAQDSPQNEFLQRFGAERYKEAMMEFVETLTVILERLAPSTALTDKDRDEIHQLSGSAAVLGQTDIWTRLQILQNASDTFWKQDGQHTLDILQKNLHVAQDSLKSITKEL